jgi:hypothetical protein
MDVAFEKMDGPTPGMVFIPSSDQEPNKKRMRASKAGQAA